jgi:hypothetical protein
MIEPDGERFRLTIPIGDAIQFAVGGSNLTYVNPSDELRQLVGLLALDSLEYTEQWRAAGVLRAIVDAKWPHLLRSTRLPDSDEEAA